MFKEIRKLKGHTKRHSFLVQGTTILSLLAVFQAYRCPGKAGNLLARPIADVIAGQTSPENLKGILGNMKDIGILLKGKDNHLPRSLLYGIINSGGKDNPTADKVNIFLAKLDTNPELSKPSFQNEPDQSSGKTPLGNAIAKGYTPAVAALIESQHIDITSVDNEKRSPLHMAAIFNREQEFRLIWNKLFTRDKTKAIDNLFQKDKKDHSVFASAYLPEPKFWRTNTSFSMFKYILGIVKDSLQATHLEKITEEIMNLQHKNEIGKKYASKLLNEVNLIKHPKPPTPTQNKKPETEEKK